MQIKQSRFFSIIADGTIDLAKIDQLSITIRYLHGYKIKESFLEFVDVSKSTTGETAGSIFASFNFELTVGKSFPFRTTGKALADKIIERLMYHELDPQQLRGQGFDGAANMRGHIKGVQAEIAKVQPKAIYTHCYAHSVNLVLKNAVNVEWIQKFYNDVNKIGKFFGTPKRRTFLMDEFGCPRGTKVPSTVCETRWTSYADVTNAAFGAYGYLGDGLEALGNNDRFDLSSRNSANSIREMMLT